MIEIKNLKKTYGNFVAIEDFNLQLEEGKTYGILSRINSGTTTIFNILCNYLLKDEGEVLIDKKTPENARDLIYICPKMEFYIGYTLRKILSFIAKFNKEFDENYALKLCDDFKIDLDKKLNPEENVSTYTIFKTIVTICMNKKYTLLNKPEVGVSSLEIRKLSDLLLKKTKENKSTTIIHSKNVNHFFTHVDKIIIIKDGKVFLFEDKKDLKERVYSISGSLALINDAIKDKHVIAIKTLKNYSKLKIAYIMAKTKDEARIHSNREISIKEIYQAITSSERRIYNE